MITFVQKQYSSDSDIAKDEYGHLCEAISHILKLKIGFNIERDGNKHRDDLYSDFLKKSLNWSFPEEKNKKKFKSKGLGKIFDYFIPILNKKKESLRRKIEADFIKYYGFKGKLKMSDIDEAIEVLGYIMNSESKEEVISKCKGLYRE